jgi:TonB family protein
MSRVVVVAAVVLSVAVSSAAVARGAEQRTTAVFSGAVLDPAGVPVADTVVFMTHIENGTQLQFVTGVDGRFEFSGLAPGAYRVTSMTSGFGRVEINLEAGETSRRDVVLQFGPFHEAWLIGPGGPAPRGPAGREWQCGSRGLPFCGPPSLVAEFERDEQERQGEPLLPPRTTRTIPMEYPAALRDARIEGRIVVDGRLGADGVLREMQVQTADRPELERATLAALADVRWEPARLRGKAVAVPLTVGIRYSLSTTNPPTGR